VVLAAVVTVQRSTHCKQASKQVYGLYLATRFPLPRPNLSLSFQLSFVSSFFFFAVAVLCCAVLCLAWPCLACHHYSVFHHPLTIHHHPPLAYPYPGRCLSVCCWCLSHRVQALSFTSSCCFLHHTSASIPVFLWFSSSTLPLTLLPYLLPSSPFLTRERV